MGEKRKASLVLMLKVPGTESLYKIELFDAGQWQEPLKGKRYRLRINGKWFAMESHPEFFTIRELCTQLSTTINTLVKGS